MRVESATITVTFPLSVFNTIELPLTDLTVPTALAKTVCASRVTPNSANNAHFTANAGGTKRKFRFEVFTDSLIIIQSCKEIKVGKELSNCRKQSRTQRACR
jgi:hypothetical protein